MPNPKHKGAKRTRPTSPSAVDPIYSEKAIAGVVMQFGKWQGQEAIVATAIVLAESGGNAHAVNPTTGIHHGWWQLSEEHGLTLADMRDPIKSTKFARRLYDGRIDRQGKSHRWDDFEVFTTKDPKRSYKRFLSQATDGVRYYDVDAGKGEVVTDVDYLPGDLESVAESAFGLAGLIASAVGKASAKWFIGTVTHIGIFAWEEVGKPIWGRTQRAVTYYRTETLRTPKGFFVTLTFWTVGYAILWRSADDLGKANRVEDTSIGRAVLAAKNYSVKRKLYTPKEAKEETKDKPTPTVSETPVAQTRVASVNRRRPVTVEFDKTTDELANKRAAKEKEGAIA